MAEGEGGGGGEGMNPAGLGNNNNDSNDSSKSFGDSLFSRSDRASGEEGILSSLKVFRLPFSSSHLCLCLSFLFPRAQGTERGRREDDAACVCERSSSPLLLSCACRYPSVTWHG